MLGWEFARSLQQRVADFCSSLEARLPAYSYIPLETDEQRIKVMKSRLFNEIRAAEIFGSWMKTTPELEVKSALAEAVHQEISHSRLLAKTLESRGAEPYDYLALPAQMAMFNAFEAVQGTVQRMAAFALAGEGVADYLIRRCLESSDVPEWVREPYTGIHADEQEHSSYPADVLAKYAITPELQDAASRGVEMSLVLRRQYFDNLDRWVFEDKAW